MEEGNGKPKPSRSDIRLSIEEEREIESKTRDYFNILAPERHTKPQRSEFSSQYSDKFNSNNNHHSIPEFDAFQRLENDSQEKITYDGNNTEIPEEFVETLYYEDLNGVDKQHHTTGTGFIKMENAESNSFRLAADSTDDAVGRHASCSGNPATNDWIPVNNDLVDFHAGKSDF